MNLLLVAADEVTEGRVLLGGRRAHHIRTVLRSAKGERLKVGIIGRGPCDARLHALPDDGRVELALEAPAAAPLPCLHVVLCVPRPKALSRIVATVSSFGARSLTLINSWRVEKSYFSSDKLRPERLQADALLGCEQGMLVHPPQITVMDKFLDFVEQHPTRRLSPDVPRIVFDPGARRTLLKMKGPLKVQEPPAPSSCEAAVLLFGPDGGLVPQELSSLDAIGYQRVNLNTGPLRTETAVAAALGQWALLSEGNSSP